MNDSIVVRVRIVDKKVFKKFQLYPKRPVREARVFIGQELGVESEQYGLFLPPKDDQSGQWFRDEYPLDFYGLEGEGDGHKESALVAKSNPTLEYVEYKKKFRPTKVSIKGTGQFKTLVLDDTKPVSELVSILLKNDHIGPLAAISEQELMAIPDDEIEILTSDMTIREQGYVGDCTVGLYFQEQEGTFGMFVRVPFYEGFLQRKKGGGITKGLKNWTKKYYVLRKNKLLYFRSKNDQQESGAILVKTITKVAEITDKETQAEIPTKYTKLALEIVTPARTYLMLASSQSELKGWVTQLEMARRMYAYETHFFSSNIGKESDFVRQRSFSSTMLQQPPTQSTATLSTDSGVTSDSKHNTPGSIVIMGNRQNVRKTSPNEHLQHTPVVIPPSSGTGVSFITATVTTVPVNVAGGAVPVKLGPVLTVSRQLDDQRPIENLPLNTAIHKDRPSQNENETNDLSILDIISQTISHIEETPTEPTTTTTTTNNENENENINNININININNDNNENITPSTETETNNNNNNTNNNIIIINDINNNISHQTHQDKSHTPTTEDEITDALLNEITSALILETGSPSMIIEEKSTITIEESTVTMETIEKQPASIHSSSSIPSTEDMNHDIVLISDTVTIDETVVVDSVGNELEQINVVSIVTEVTEVSEMSEMNGIGESEAEDKMILREGDVIEEGETQETIIPIEDSISVIDETLESEDEEQPRQRNPTSTSRALDEGTLQDLENRFKELVEECGDILHYLVREKDTQNLEALILSWANFYLMKQKRPVLNTLSELQNLTAYGTLLSQLQPDSIDHLAFNSDDLNFKATKLVNILSSLDVGIDFEVSHFTEHSTPRLHFGVLVCLFDFLGVDSLGDVYTEIISRRVSATKYINTLLQQSFTPLNLLSSLHDGNLLYNLLNKFFPNVMDSRLVDSWKNENKNSVTNTGIHRKLLLVANAARSLGGSLQHYDLHNPQYYIRALHEIVWGVVEMCALQHANPRFSLTSLYGLKGTLETSTKFQAVPPSTALLRWVNFNLRKNTTRSIANFTDDLEDSENLLYLLETVVPPHMPHILDEIQTSLQENDWEKRAEKVIEISKLIGCMELITPRDISEAENSRLAVVFIAEILRVHKQLPQVPEEKLKKDLETMSIVQDSFETEQERTKDDLLKWISSLNIGVEVKDLSKDLRDGTIFLKVLDKVVPPGFIDSRKLQSSPGNLVFKMVELCNYVLEVVARLKLNVPNVGGPDLVNGDIKATIALLDKIEKYSKEKDNVNGTTSRTSNRMSKKMGYLTPTPSLSPSPSAKNVAAQKPKENPIIEWANEKVLEYTTSKGNSNNNNSSANSEVKQVHSFKDQFLQDGLFLVQLMAALSNPHSPGYVQNSFVTLGVTDEDREINARYILSLVWGWGVDTGSIQFSDLVRVRSKQIKQLLEALKSHLG